MVTETIPLKKGARFHARPAGRLAKRAGDFSCMIMLQTSYGFADARDFLSLMRLTPGPAAQVDVLTDGEDEKEAAQAMKVLILELMDDMAVMP